MPAIRELFSRCFGRHVIVVVFAGVLVLLPAVAAQKPTSKAEPLQSKQAGKSRPSAPSRSVIRRECCQSDRRHANTRRYRQARSSSWDSAFWGEAMATQGMGLKPAPLGLVATIQDDPTQPLDLRPFRNPYISGIGLQIHWSDIEPAPGRPNWARLDELFAAARSSHKWVHLYIFPGFFSPTWVLQTAETAPFKVQYGPGASGPGSSRSAPASDAL